MTAIFSHVLMCVPSMYAPPTYNDEYSIYIVSKSVCCYSIENRIETRIKTLKKESDVGMLLTGVSLYTRH